MFSSRPSPHFERLRAAAARSEELGVAFHPLVPEEALVELYARSSIQILPQAKNTSDGALPSKKLPNLIAAGVPVLVISDAGSEAATLLEQAGSEAGPVRSRVQGEAIYESLLVFLRRVGDQPRAARNRAAA